MERWSPWFNPYEPFNPYKPIYDYLGIDPITLKDIYPSKSKIRFSRKKIRRNK